MYFTPPPDDTHGIATSENTSQNRQDEKDSPPHPTRRRSTDSISATNDPNTSVREIAPLDHQLVHKDHDKTLVISDGPTGPFHLGPSTDQGTRRHTRSELRVRPNQPLSTGTCSLMKGPAIDQNIGSRKGMNEGSPAYKHNNKPSPPQHRGTESFHLTSVDITPKMSQRLRAAAPSVTNPIDEIRNPQLSPILGTSEARNQQYIEAGKGKGRRAPPDPSKINENNQSVMIMNKDKNDIQSPKEFFNWLLTSPSTPFRRNGTPPPLKPPPPN